MVQLRSIFCTASVLLGTVACSHHHRPPPPPPGPAPSSVAKAVSILQPAKGKRIRGTVYFRQTAQGVEVTADVQGLAARSEHGFHIHENGDCTATDFSSAGGHYNPHNSLHGGPKADHRHVGDLGNLKADARGQAHYAQTIKNIDIQSQKMSLLGRSVVVHEKRDDLNSQPSGDSGARIACGVIGLAP